MSLISSTALLCFFGLFASCCCCVDFPISFSTLPLLFACFWTLSAAFSLEEHGEGFSLASCLLVCLVLVMVVLLRRVTGPLVSAVSLISAASVTLFLPARHCWSNCPPLVCPSVTSQQELNKQQRDVLLPAM